MIGEGEGEGEADTEGEAEGDEEGGAEGEGDSSGEVDGEAEGEEVDEGDGVREGGVVAQASKTKGSKKARIKEERRIMITICFLAGVERKLSLCSEHSHEGRVGLE